MLSDDQAPLVPVATVGPPAGPFGDVPLARPIAEFYAAPAIRPRDPILLPSLRVSAAWADLGLIILAMMALELLSSLGIHIWLSASGQLGEEGPPPQFIQQILMPLLSVRAAWTFLIITILVRVRGLSAASVGLRRRGFIVDVLLGIAATPVAYAAIWFTLGLVYLVWPTIWKEMQENTSRLLEFVPPLGLLGFLPASFLIGTYEELLFRGFLMTRLRRATGSWIIGVIISSAIFTAPHGLDQTKGALIVIGVLSLLLSVLTIWRRSIVPAIVAHALFDYSQFVLLGFSQKAS